MTMATSLLTLFKRILLMLTVVDFACCAGAGHLTRHVRYDRAAYDDAVTARQAVGSTDKLQQDLFKLQSDLSALFSNLQTRLERLEDLVSVSQAATSSATIAASRNAAAPSVTPIRSSFATGISFHRTTIARPSHTSTGHFDPLSTSNVAVYYGQTANTQTSGLVELCSMPAVNIVNLAFVPTFFTSSGYPATTFGPACVGQNQAQAAINSQLQNCEALGRQITTCQQLYNTKILVSLGGYIASSAFPTQSDATDFADTLWDLFGGGVSKTPRLRPFGNATVDGFDIDNENHSTDHYEAFLSALRSRFIKDPARTYYISAAPQCPRPDASISDFILKHADFVWVQFYNNPSCNLDSAGFLESFLAWSADLDSSRGYGPRVFIGMGAWPGAGPGYVPGTSLASVVARIKSLNVTNLGGIMLWDGTEGLLNKDSDGASYIDMAKMALG